MDLIRLRRSTSFLNTAEIASLIYRFQEKGLAVKWQGPFFASSITILAMTAETGEPIAVPKPVGFEAKR